MRTQAPLCHSRRSKRESIVLSHLPQNWLRSSPPAKPAASRLDLYPLLWIEFLPNPLRMTYYKSLLANEDKACSRMPRVTITISDQIVKLCRITSVRSSQCYRT